jgi:hypothetical protein
METLKEVTTGVGAFSPAALVSTGVGAPALRKPVKAANVVFKSNRKTAVSAEPSGRSTMLKNDFRVTLNTREDCDHNRSTFKVSEAFQAQYLIKGTDEAVAAYEEALEANSQNKRNIKSSDFGVTTNGLEAVYFRDENGENPTVMIVLVPTTDTKPVKVEKYNNTFDTNVQWDLVALGMLEQFKAQHPTIDFTMVRGFEANLVGKTMYALEEGDELNVFTSDKTTSHEDMADALMGLSEVAKLRRTIKGDAKGKYLVGQFELVVDSLKFITEEWLAGKEERSAQAKLRSEAKAAKALAGGHDEVAVEDEANEPNVVATLVSAETAEAVAADDSDGFDL